MKRANVLRLAAILAVVVLASMTTGCLKASVSLEVLLDPTEYTVGENLKGTMTVIATGVGKAGIYTDLTVEFLDGDGAAMAGATLNVTNLQIPITPWSNESQTFELIEYEGLVIPVEAVDAAKAKFILTGGGFAVTPIFDEVDITVTARISRRKFGFCSGVPGSLHYSGPYLISPRMCRYV